MPSRLETVEKMNAAKKMQQEGKSIEEIAEEMQLSSARIRELLKGVNWDSKSGTHKPIE